MLLPFVASLLLRSPRTVQRARRLGSLLLAFAYLQAGMLVAVLSVSNFALAASLAVLTYAALRIASGRPSVAPPLSTPVNAFSWVGSFRSPAVVLFQPHLLGHDTKGFGRWRRLAD